MIVSQSVKPRLQPTPVELDDGFADENGNEGDGGGVMDYEDPMDTYPTDESQESEESTNTEKGQ